MSSFDDNIFEDLGGGLTIVDTGLLRPRHAGAYLLVRDREAAIVETGTVHSVPRLLRAIERAGLEPPDVRWVIVTHVHLDHAGGAGALLRHLPRATLVAHPRGARHLVDPTRLVAGAVAVYGEEAVRRHYGELAPAPEDRVRSIDDGEALSLGREELRFLHTPGHARHHLCVHAPSLGGVFTGDLFGISYDELRTQEGPFVYPTTTPVQFDPEAMEASIRRILDLDPDRLLLTHYGALSEPARRAADLLDLMGAFVEAARRAPEGPGRAPHLRRAIDEILWQAYRSMGGPLPIERARAYYGIDVELNAQGLEVWLERERSSRS